MHPLLLIRRSITDPTEHAYYLCYGPADTNDEDLIRVAGTRWAIEECFQTAKGQVGLDDYQVRRYDAWYRQITTSTLPVSSDRLPAHVRVLAVQRPRTSTSCCPRPVQASMSRRYVT